MNVRNRHARFYRTAILVAALLIALLAATAALAQDGRSPEIVGGQEADPGEWPWQVALVKKGSDLYQNQFCGGTLIAGTWVVTAAHCITEWPTPLTINDLDIVAGVHDLSNPGANIQRRTIAEIIVHPDWNPSNNDNDITLLRLSSPINERPAGSGVLPIQYADLAPKAIGDLVGANTTVTGWGNRTPGGNDYPPRLHEVVVPVVSNAACAAAYSGTAVQITANMLCAGFETGGKDSCQGDSGGPLVYNNSGTWQLVGVVSFGIGCADARYPGIYARVSRYIDWINAETSPGPTGPNKIFFPVVLDVAPVTPPPPAGFVNGNFEAGPAGWDQYSSNGFELILQDFEDNDIDAHSGTWAAWLGGWDDETSVLSQEVTVSAGQKFLNFYYYIYSLDNCGYDFGWVYVDGNLIEEYDLCANTTSAPFTWTKVSLDLTAYAGQSVLVEFVVETDDSLNSNWFIDDVSFAASMSAATEAPAPGGPAVVDGDRNK